MQINLARQLKNGDAASVSVTYGHEAFLHAAKKNVGEFVKALKEGNNQKVQALFQEYRKNVRAETDHINYQKFSNSKFNAYTKSLGKLFIYSPQDIQKARSTHDKHQKALYGKLSKK